jgi:pimeloyl-ACP methyl ester carboxylesterase
MLSPAAGDPRARGSRTLRRVLIGLLLLVILAYVAATLHLMLRETELIFRTDVARADTRPAFPYEEVTMPRSDGARQIAWLMKRQDTRPDGGPAGSDDVWVLYLHGNASTIGSRMNVAHYTRLRELGVNVLAPEYRGYNGLEGVPTEAGVGVDARAAYDYLRTREHVPPERLAIFGWSLGAAVAVDLAAQVDTRAVILEGAPASIVDIGQERYPMFPIRLIIRNPFHAIRKVSRIRAPILFLHSPEDKVVPFAEGRRLFEAAPSPKTFVEVRGGHIEASEVDRDRFYGAIRTFLQLPLELAPAASRLAR